MAKSFNDTYNPSEEIILQYRLSKEHANANVNQTKRLHTLSELVGPSIITEDSDIIRILNETPSESCIRNESVSMSSNYPMIDWTLNEYALPEPISPVGFSSFVVPDSVVTSTNDAFSNNVEAVANNDVLLSVPHPAIDVQKVPSISGMYFRRHKPKWWFRTTIKGEFTIIL